MEPDPVKRGAIAGIIWGVFVVVSNLPQGHANGPALLSLEESLIEAAFAGLMSWGVHRRSRVCVSLLLIQILAGGLSAALLLEQFTRALIALPFLFVVGQAAIAVFQYRRSAQVHGSSAVRFLGLGLGSLTVAGFVALAFVALESPPTRILPGSQIPSRYVADIADLGLVEPDETLLFFYSPGLLDIREELYLLTDSKLVAYSEQWASPAIFVGFRDIAELDIEFATSWLNDSNLVVSLVDGSELFVPLSSEGGGDRRFYDRLETLWKQSGDAAATE